MPKVIQYGEYDNHEWIMTEYIAGEILENNFTKLNEENIALIFRELGETLGKIHSYKIFNFAIGWDEKVNYNNYKKNKINEFNNIVEGIHNQNLPDEELLLKAINIIKEHYEEIFSVTEFRLTHNDFDGRNILINNNSGIYRIEAVIDFEQSYPDNCENDLTNLYYKYFINNKQYEKWFIEGYNLYMTISKDFYNNLKYYLCLMVIEHCCWSYEKANDYYNRNIEFLRNILK